MNGIFASFARKLKFKKQRKHFPAEVCEKIDRFLSDNNIKAFSPDLYIEALTHRSFVEIEDSVDTSNQRLEYLGDAVLGMVAAEFLFKKFPADDEGFLTKTRSNIVKKDALAHFAQNLELHKYVLYDHRFIEENEAGFNSILVDCLEALIGAIYLDAGFRTAEEFILQNVVEPSRKDGFMSRDTNFKGRLLELLHSMKMEGPVYETVHEEGAEHRKVFTVVVECEGKRLGAGKGRNKKSAEQNAAKNALDELNG